VLPPPDVDTEKAGQHDAKLPSVGAWHEDYASGYPYFHARARLHSDPAARPRPSPLISPGLEHPSDTASANCRHGETQRLRCFNIAGGVVLLFMMVAFDTALLTGGTRCSVGHEPSTCTAWSRRLGTTATGPSLVSWIPEIPETGILELQGLSSPRVGGCPLILANGGQNEFQSGMIRIHNV
jgi:hypothetical protein